MSSDADIPRERQQTVLWSNTAMMAPRGRIVLGVATLVMILLTFATFAAGGSAGWIIAIGTVLIATLVATQLAFRVQVRQDGLLIRSVYGWPRTMIPLSDVASVAVTEINPFPDFGGWGWRYGANRRRGVVLRKGEALEVTRSDGRVFVVTVDGAKKAATILRKARKA